MHTVRIGVHIYPGGVAASATGPADVFRIANALVRWRPASEHVRFEPVWVSAKGGQVRQETGVIFDTVAIAEAGLHAIFVPGIDHDKPTSLVQAVEGMAVEQEALRALPPHVLVAAHCTGTFLAAEAGLLDGRRCTTSWWVGKHFAQRYPSASLEGDQLMVVDGHVLTAGGMTSFLDLSLWLVGHFGGDALRQMTAKFMVTDPNRLSQTPYVAAALAQAPGHAVVEQARRWLNQHLDKEWSMEALAEACHTSTRTLLRRFREAQGMTPVQYAQQLRVERAKGLLESTALSLETITERCGYEDVSTFSKVFKRWTEVTPREYRHRFGLRR